MVGGGRGEGVLGTNFQLLMLSPSLLKPKGPIMVLVVGGGWGVGNQLPTFDAESKSA